MTKEEGKELTNWQEKLAVEAKQESALARPSSSTISLRSGLITYEGQPAPDNKLQVIVIAVADERTFYPSKYDPNNIQSPSCFAIDRVGSDLAPHEKAEDPQHETCEGCPRDKWGSDLGGGRGKACQQRKRLVVIPAGVEDAEGIMAAEVATMKLPVTSVKNWDGHVLNVARTAQRPTWAVITEITAQPDPKTQFKVGFSYISDIDPIMLGALEEKQQMVEPVLFKPYDANQGDEDSGPKAKGSKHKD